MIRYICSLLTLFLVVGVLAGQTTTFFPFKVNASIGVFNSGGSGDYIGFVGTVGTTGFIVDSVRVNDVLVDDTGKQFRVVDFTVTVPGSIVQLEVDAIGGGVAPLSGRGSLVRPSPFYKFLPITQDGSNYITAEQQTKMLNNNAYRMDSVMNAQYVQLSQLQLNAGSNRDTITQALHGFSVSTTKFRPVRVTGDETWLGTSALGEAFFPDAYVVDSIDGNTFAIQYSGALTTVGWHGYVPGSTLYLGDTFGTPQTTPGTIPVIVASIPDSNTIILMPMPVLVPSTGTTNLTTARTNTVDSIKSSSGADVVLERAIKYSAPPVSPSTTTEKTTLHIDPTGEIFKAFDTEIDVHVPVRFDYTVSGVADVRNLKAANGRQIEVRSTNARYIVQAATPVGYTQDSTAVIQLTSGNYAVIQTDGVLYLEDFGLVSGTGLTKAQRTTNWRRFKRALDFAKVVKGDVTISVKNKATYEFHVHDGTGYVNTSNIKMTWDFKGSKLYFYPRVTAHYFELLFTGGNYEVDFILKNAEFYTYRPGFETYSATLKPSGNLDTIIITDSQIRTDFATDVVGSQIFVSYSYDQKADTITVSGYNPTTKIITLNRNLNLPSATNDDAGWIGLKWDIDFSNSDTITRYEQFWLIENTGISFIESIPNPANTKTNFEFYNVKTDGFYSVINKSNGEGRILMENCDMSAHTGVVGNFENQAVYSETILKNCFFHDTGFESIGQNPGNPSATGDRYNAGTVYTHPNTHLDVDGCIFDNAMVAIRQYSSTGDKPLPAYVGSSIIRNSKFYNQLDQYHVFTSHMKPTIIDNCTFSTGGVWTRNEVFINNCTFEENAYVFQSILDNDYNKSLTIDNSYFKESSFLSVVGPNHKLVIKNTNIELANDYSGAGTAFGIPNGSSDTLYMENVNIYSPDDSITTYSSLWQNEYSVMRLKNVSFKLHSSDIVFSRWTNTDKAILDDVRMHSGIFLSASQLSSGVRPFKITNSTGIEGGLGRFMFYDKEFGKGTNTETVTSSSHTFTNPTYLTLPAALTIRLNTTNYNHYRIDGIAKRIIFSTSATDWGTHVYSKGNIILECDGAGVTIPAYNPATADSTSNFMFDLGLSDGQLKEVYFDPYAFAVGTNATSTMTDEVIGTTTTALKYVFWQTIDPGGDSNHGLRVIPGTVTIKVNGVTFGVDDGKGNISGALGTGTISYFKNVVVLNFTNTPVASESVTITANYVNRANGFHYIGAFYDPANVPDGVVLPTGTPNRLTAWDGSGNFTSSNVTIDAGQTDLTTPYYIMSKGFVTPNRTSEGRGVSVNGVDMIIGSANGAVEITIPAVVGSGYYWSMEVEINGNSSGTEIYNINGYYVTGLTQGSSQYGASCQTKYGTRIVRWGNDGTNFKVWIGELTSTLIGNVITINSFKIYDNLTENDIDYDYILNGITLSTESSAFNTVSLQAWPTVSTFYSPTSFKANTIKYNINDNFYLGNFTGAIEIVVPTSLLSKRITLDVEINADGFRRNYLISGSVAATGSGAWTNTEAKSVSVGGSNVRANSVRFGNDGTNPIIWIGELTGETYGVCAVHISEATIKVGTNPADFPYITTPFICTIESSAFNTVNSTLSLIDNIYQDKTTNNVGIGAGATTPTDLLHAAGSGNRYINIHSTNSGSAGLKFSSGGNQMIFSYDNPGDAGMRLSFGATQLIRFGTNGSMKIGGTGAAVTSSIFELESTTKGFLLPRMTTAQKDAISSPAEGLEVFDTDLDKKQVYIGSTWESVYSGDVYKTHNFLSDANEIFGTSPQYLDTLYNYGFTVGQDIAGKQLVEISFSLLDETTDDFDIRVIYYDVSAGTLTPLATATIANGAHTVTQTGLSQVLSMGDHLLLDVVDPGTDVTARAYVTSTLRIKTN